MKFRKATRNDISKIVEIIADDDLGKTREDFRHSLPNEYLKAFENINSVQVSFIQYLTYRGGVRAQIEAVRMRKDQRGKRLGKKMFEWAINRAIQRNAHLLQLTTDKKDLKQ